ncbi:MAG: alpha/beta fold hydrolase [Myxococcota bacterium]
MLRALTAMQHRQLGVSVREHVDARGRRTPWLDLGTPREGTIVWLHGFADRPDTFLRVAPRLVGDYRIIAPAMPAFGEGWRDPAETHTLDAFGEWLHDVLDAIVVDDVHLVGNSLGGATAMAVAARRPAWLRSLVPLNSAGVRTVDAPSVLEEFEAGQNLFEIRAFEDYHGLMSRLFAVPAKLPPFLDAFLFSEYARQADWFVRVTDDLSATEERFGGEGWTAAIDLSAIDVPTLVLWGDRDTLFPVSHAQVLARHIPDARLELIPGIGHCPHLESPGRLATALRRFVKTL